jgi:hypothetical protein
MRIAFLLLAALPTFAARRAGIVRAGGSPVAPSGTVTHMHHVQVSRPSPVVNQEHFIHDSRQVAFPRADGGGRAITQAPARLPPQHHAGIVRNEAVVRDIRGRERAETVPGRYYWHESGGVRYAHFYDHFGVHWYGFYVGPTFYWTRWWGARWWWWDPVFFRWVYWHDGYWWWQGPDGLVYVYVDNDYYPYDEGVGGVTTAQSRQVPPSSAASPPSSGGKAYYSPDGKRMVRLYGDQGEAFLYDLSSEPPKFKAYVAANVTGVRFTGGKDGKPLEFLLDFKDGTFGLFDEEGRSLSGAPAPQKPVQAAPAPDVAPPPAPEPGEVPGPSATRTTFAMAQWKCFLWRPSSAR